MERMQAQKRALEQARAAAPAETGTALAQALEETERAYQTVSAAEGDANRFRQEYRHRYEGTPPCTPQQNQDQTQDHTQEQTQDQTQGDPSGGGGQGDGP